MKPALGELVARVTARVDGAVPAGRRVMIGIAGSPGAGKTTLAQVLVARLVEDLGADRVAYVPMDGFHLADIELDRIGLRDRKGAPATFDVFGYIALLRRLRENADPLVYVPGFERLIEQPIAGSLPVFQAAQVIVTEGNYLLLDGDWTGVRPQLDEIWFCRTEPDLRTERLLARHLRFGKSEEFARSWMDQTDRPNADLIEASAAGADLQIDAD